MLKKKLVLDSIKFKTFLFYSEHWNNKRQKCEKPSSKGVGVMGQVGGFVLYFDSGIESSR